MIRGIVYPLSFIIKIFEESKSMSINENIFQPINKLNTDNPPKGGSGVPPRSETGCGNKNPEILCKSMSCDDCKNLRNRDKSTNIKLCTNEHFDKRCCYEECKRCRGLDASSPEYSRELLYDSVGRCKSNPYYEKLSKEESNKLIVKEFKLWFKGFEDALQHIYANSDEPIFKTLKEKIENLKE